MILSLPTSAPALHFFLCGFHQGSEDGTRGIIVIDRALRMPLHSQDKVIRVGALERLYDSILRTARHNAQSFSDSVSRLMMAGVHGQPGGVGLCVCQNLCQP